MFIKYTKEITNTIIRGDAREESFYSSLAELLKEFANSVNHQNIQITILPKKTEAGNPDFRIWDGNQHIIGYIEAKYPGTNLDKIESSEQLERYLKTFPNLILTDFFEFRLFRNGVKVTSVTIGKSYTALELGNIPPINNISEIEKFLTLFYDFSLPKVYSAETLAIELAKRTRFLRDEIIKEELLDNSKKINHILGFYEAFEKYLIYGLNKEEFADIYSQTICYGLFAARSRTRDKFNRRLAFSFIPSTIGMLKDVFEFISLGKLPIQMEVIIDDIAEVLFLADIQKILDDFYKKHKGDDPIIHFYETFLNEYDPSTRQKRGVYYTPEPIVNYIVNSINEILIDDFNKSGLDDFTVNVLDPASGTMTFLSQATKKAISNFQERFGSGGIHNFIKTHILRNFYGFELMMSPYAIAHLKMSFILQDYGYYLEDDDRYQLYLTNTLDATDLSQTQIPGMSSLSLEAYNANLIKKKTPVLAILGNPPYSISSYNKSIFEAELMKLYKEDVKNEKNIQILTDDYIKFVRFCHWKIEQSGSGVIGLITKNTYLNIAAAKGMRKQILKTFDKVYILNLHGKLYEKTPQGEKDQSVFDIRVGTAIMFLIKNNTKKNNSYAKLYYKDLYGTRDFKYNFLNNENIFSTFKDEDRLEIDKEHYFFEKKVFSKKKLYYQFLKIDHIFSFGKSGVQTGKDNFVLDNKKQSLIVRLNRFVNLDYSPQILKELFNLNSQAIVSLANYKKEKSNIDENKIIKYSHKPFSNLFIYYDKSILRRNSYELMSNFFKINVGLVLARRFNYNFKNPYFITENVTDINFLGGQSYIFPLWVYKQNGDAFNGKGKYNDQVSNINEKLEQLLNITYKKQDITEDIFYYIYADLYSNIYRNEFSEILKIDYPRIPFTNNFKLFEKLSALGYELSNYHLLKHKNLNNPKVRFQGQGNNLVHNPKFILQQNIIQINETQYFDNINQSLWEFEIGKNKIIHRWLKQRIGKYITFEDIMDFCKIATAIYETLIIQNEIDKYFPDILNSLLKVTVINK